MTVASISKKLVNYQQNFKLNQFAGNCVAIDANIFINKIRYLCPTEIALNLQSDMPQRVFKNYIRLFLNNNISPVFVFDAYSNQPNEDNLDDSSRKQIFDQGVSFYQNQNDAEARKCFLKTNKTFPRHLTVDLVKTLISFKVPYIFSPKDVYSMLCYFNSTGRVTSILSQKSDILLCNCNQVLTNIDKYGNGIWYDMKEMEEETIKRLQFANIINGTSKNKGLEGYGITKAINLYDLYKGDVKSIFKHLFLLHGEKMIDGFYQEFLSMMSYYNNPVIYDLEKRLIRELTTETELKGFEYPNRNFSNVEMFEIISGNYDLSTDQYSPIINQQQFFELFLYLRPNLGPRGFKQDFPRKKFESKIPFKRFSNQSSGGYQKYQ